MSFTVQEAITAIRADINEIVVDRHIKDTELIEWLNEALADLAIDYKFLQRKGTLAPGTYLTAYGTDPKLYELPADFISIDRGNGIKFNGLRRLPTDGYQYDRFQEQALGESSLITTSDFFAENFDGITFHYAVEFVLYDEVTKSPTPGTGKIAWFTPNPNSTDTIVYWYNCLHPTLTTTGGTGLYSDKIYWPVELKKHLITEVALMAISKKAMIPGALMVSTNGIQLLQMRRNECKKRTDEYFKNKSGEKRIRIFTPRQLQSRYNSRQPIHLGTTLW